MHGSHGPGRLASGLSSRLSMSPVSDTRASQDVASRNVVKSCQCNGKMFRGIADRGSAAHPDAHPHTGHCNRVHTCSMLSGVLCTRNSGSKPPVHSGNTRGKPQSRNAGWHGPSHMLQPKTAPTAWDTQTPR